LKENKLTKLCVKEETYFWVDDVIIYQETYTVTNKYSENNMNNAGNEWKKKKKLLIRKNYAF